MRPSSILPVLLLIPTTALAEADQVLSASNAEPSDDFGYAVSGVGDVDGDGFDDILATSSLDAAYLFYGSNSAEPLGREQQLAASQVDFVRQVSGAGDVNGDGFDDALLGNAWLSGSGQVSVLYGSSLGLDPAASTLILPTDGRSNDMFGASLSDVGDLDGDGFDDVVVGAPGAGAFYTYYGSSSGLRADSEARIPSADVGRWVSRFGHSVSGAGDLNGDGYNDVVVGAPDGEFWAGAAFVYYGSAAGLLESSEDLILAGSPEPYSSYGTSVAGGGDLNGDGYDDIAVGTPNQLTGRVHVFYGSASGVVSGTDQVVSPAALDSGDQFGWSVAMPGDLNLDGYDDLIVSAYSAEDEGGSGVFGEAWLLYGSATGVDTATAVMVSDTDSRAGGGYGWVVSGAGDVNGDGVHDAMVGGAVDAQIRGVVFVYAGVCLDADGDGTCLNIDCDDANPDIFPGATELCDDIDNDCDDVVDEDDAADALTWYVDADGDGYGDASETTLACLQPSGFSADSTDCDDTNASVSPSAVEVCDGLATDEDCDGLVNDDDDSVDPASQSIAYEDNDGDGYGSAEDAVSACILPSDLVSDSSDCNDAHYGVNPGADEVPDDGVDQDCDGADLESPASGSDDGKGGCAVAGGFGSGVGAFWLAVLSLVAAGRRRTNAHLRS